MEYASGGNLQQLVKAQHRIDECKAQELLWQLTEAVDYIHSQRVCHRDLKLENFVRRSPRHDICSARLLSAPDPRLSRRRIPASAA